MTRPLVHWGHRTPQTRLSVTRRLGALFNRHSDPIAPLRPGSVVVPHVVQTEQIAKHEPGVAGSFTDTTVNDRLLLRGYPAALHVDFLQFIRRLECAVIVY